MKYPIPFLALLMVAAAFWLDSDASLAQDTVAKKDAPKIQYELSFPDSSSHYAHLALTFTADSDSPQLMIPTWTPGSYLIREYSRFVQELGCTDADGRKVPFAKTRKNRWTLKTKKGRRVQFRYKIYCRELSVRTNWVEENLAVLNGAATFITPVGQLDRQHEVVVKLPKSWPRVVSALPKSEGHNNGFLAADYDQLVDNPILCGDCHIFPFTAGGKNHYLVNLGQDDLWDGDKAAKDLKKLVEAHHKFWGTIPYKEYYFLNVVLNGGGGLEHDNCTLIMSGRWTCQRSDSYLRWLSLASHEFFHTWNVRRLRPKTLMKYDYENEVYLRQLWIAEGITSYYQNLILARSGLMSGNRLLRSISGDIRTIENMEGNKVQSLSDASYDAWIKYYRPHENSRNTTISYYDRGSVAAFLLDAEIRSATDGEKSLDDVMIHLYQNYLATGYTSKEFRQVCSKVAGKDLTPWFQNAIDRPGALNYQPALDHLGLDLTGWKSSRPSTIPSIGASLKESEGRLLISAIRPESAAKNARLSLDDEIIAVGKQRVTDRSSFDRELGLHKVGQIVNLLISRRGKITQLPVQLEGRPTAVGSLFRVSRNRKLTANWNRWLGKSVPQKKKPAKKQPEKEGSSSK